MPNALDCCVVTVGPSLLVVLFATGLTLGRPWGDQAPPVIGVMRWVVPTWVGLMVLIRVAGLVELGRTASSSARWIVPVAYVAAAVDAAFLLAVLAATALLASRSPHGPTSLGRMAWLCRRYHAALGVLATGVATYLMWSGSAWSEMLISLAFVLVIAVIPGLLVPGLLDRAVAAANAAPARPR